MLSISSMGDLKTINSAKWMTTSNTFSSSSSLIRQLYELCLVTYVSGMIDLRLFTLMFHKCFIISNIHNNVFNYRAELIFQLFRCGFCILNGVIQQRTANHFNISDMRLVAQYTGQ